MASDSTGPTVDPGTCRLCGETIYRDKARVHLKRCRREAVERLGPDLEALPMLQIAITDRWNSAYWLQVELSSEAPLALLDDFLREIWCEECCDHLSGFDIGQQHFANNGDLAAAFGNPTAGAFAGSSAERSMDVPVKEVLTKGTKFRYIYDYGTSTELELKVVDQRRDVLFTPLVKLLARNDPPNQVCGKCGQPATEVCIECGHEPAGWLCEKHAKLHRCGEEMLLPVLNSPRVGQCGYIGPADDPRQATALARLTAATMPDDVREQYYAISDLCTGFSILHLGYDGSELLNPVILLGATEPEPFMAGQARDWAAATILATDVHTRILADADDGAIDPAEVPALIRADAEAARSHADRLLERMAEVGLTAEPDDAPAAGLRLVD